MPAGPYLASARARALAEPVEIVQTAKADGNSDTAQIVREGAAGLSHTSRRRRRSGRPQAHADSVATRRAEKAGSGCGRPEFSK